MANIKKVLQFSNLRSIVDYDLKNIMVDSILACLPKIEYNLDNLHITYKEYVGNIPVGEIVSFKEFVEKSTIGLEVKNIVEEKLKNKNYKSKENNESLILVVDIDKNHTHIGNRYETFAQQIKDALPYFDNDYNKIYLTCPYDINNHKSGSIITFFELSNHYTEFYKVNPYLENTAPKFYYDEKTGIITDDKCFGVNYVYNSLIHLTNTVGNYKQVFLNSLFESLDKLIQNFPENIVEIKNITYYDYNAQPQTYYYSPLLSLSNKINSHEVLNFILEKYPPFKEYFNIDSEYYKGNKDNKNIRIFLKEQKSPLWLQQVQNYPHSVRQEYLYTFYKNGVIQKNDSLLSEEEFNFYSYSAFQHGIYKNDIKFIKNELSNPEKYRLLIDIINGVHKPELSIELYKYPIRLSSNLEILTLLKNYNFPFFCYGENINSSIFLQNSEVQNLFDSISNKNIKSDLTLDLLTPVNPFYESFSPSFYNNLKNFCELFPDFKKTEIISKFASKILSNIHVNDIESLFTEFSFIDYSGIDVFSHLFQKRTIGTKAYSLAIQCGADPRICEQFIEKVVHAREDGLKLLRLLNKEGIVVVKNPDYLFSIYNNNPTKNFVTYFDKSPDELFSKYTANGNLVWWGCDSEEQIKSKARRVNDITQNSKDGKSVFHYFANKEHKKPNSITLENVVKIMFGSSFDTNTQKFDLSYTYPENGNNILHEIFTFSTFKKYLNPSCLSLFDQYCESDFALLFSQTNNNGQTPLDLLINQHQKKTETFNFSTIINYIVKQFEDRIDYTHTLSENNILVDSLKPFLSKDVSLIIEECYMKQIVEKNTSTSIVKKSTIKKF